VKSKIKKNIFIAGHLGMVGSALFKMLKSKKKYQIITQTKNQLDLLDFNKVNSFFKKKNIDQIYIAAAKAGGIIANIKYQSKFLFENSMIALNIIHAAYLNNIKKILYFGSSCIYPKNMTNLKENDLLNGPLELTNEGYAISKILGIKLCEKYSRDYNLDFRAIMPCNLFGPNDKFDNINSHVIPALVKKFIIAKNKKIHFVEVMGSGKPRREFLFVEDLANAAYFIMNLKKKKFYKVTNNKIFLNVGYGKDFTIKKIAEIIKKSIQYNGKIIFNRNFPDGNSKKMMDSSKINYLGWKPKFDFEKTLIEYTKGIEKKFKFQERL
jgi:GDP-L-fucose synthase